MARKIGTKEGRRGLNEAWKRIRRGWYLGGAGFWARLRKSSKQAVSKGAAASYSGEAKRAHGQAEAAHLLAEGMAVLRMSEEDFERGQKSMREKQVLAWWLRQRTIVGRRWMSQWLKMGEEFGVTRAVRSVKASQDAKLKRTKDQLLKGVSE
jgi:hypothetical protein